MTSKPATSVPNDFPIVQAVYATGLYDLTTHEGQAAFVDQVVIELHAKDARWGHLKKNPGQTQIHGHAEDAALYLSPNEGQSTAVDFVAGAGGSNPTPAWQPDIPRYSASDWMDPADHDGGEPAAPASFPYPDEPTTIKAYQDRVQATYVEAGRSFPDPADMDAFRWFTRYGFDCRVMPEPEAADLHLAELRSELGLPPA
jgi:hypothetical protein